MNCRLVALAFALALAGCCAPISTTTEQVKASVATDLPAGSSEAQVQRFCLAHGFAYSSGPDWGNAHREVGGCVAPPQAVWMQIRYNGARNLTAIDVYGGTLEP
ncbi:MAG TPA: hypothetical protein VGI81_29075 [Tepidisphaeraceae bacterium]|jgi:hypothetical protein